MQPVVRSLPASSGRRRLHRAWRSLGLPVTASRVAVMLGLLCLADALLPQLRASVPVVPYVSHTGSVTTLATVAVAGVVLLRVAAGLRRRKRVAWRIATFAGVLITVADVLRPQRRPAEAALTLLLLGSLIAGRKSFTARPDPRGRWAALRLAAQALVVACGYGLVSLNFGSLVPSNTPWSARLAETLRSLVGLGGGIALHDDRLGDVFHATLLLWGSVTFVSVMVVLLRSPGPLPGICPDDEQRLRDLLGRQGDRDSLGYFALRGDKSVVWSPSGKSAITYRVVCGVALISGDPLGDPEAWPGAIGAFQNLATSYGWAPAAIGCSETGATVLRRELGLNVLELGDEAVVEVDAFRLDGRAMRAVRQACSRAERAGYVVEIRRVDELDGDQLAELRACAAAWRGDAVERGFSMALSRLGGCGDDGCLVVTARREGQLFGLLHFVPWGRHGVSLDLMRRDRSSDNGLNEYMITKLLQACSGRGIERVSLNFAVFRNALERGGQIGAGPVIRLWRRLLLVASRWWQIESLYRFNEKFRPTWCPRYFCYPAMRDVPRVALAALEAEAFVVRPRLLAAISGGR